MGAYLLVVESDGDLQSRVAETLRDSSYEIAAETDVSWARRSIAVRPPDLLILDTLLSDGPAFSLADDLRRDAETRNIPILFVASQRFRGAEHRAEIRRRYSPADYLLVPSELPQLRQRVDRTLGQETRQETRQETPDETPQSEHGRQEDEGQDESQRDDPQGVPPRASTAPRMTSARGATPANAAAGRGVPTYRTPSPDLAQQRERRHVEQVARTLAHTPPDLRGTLTNTPFARLLQQMFAARATGSLLLIQDDTKKIVSFAEGYPVSVRSNVLAECLGQILVQERLISNETLQESVRRMRVEKRHQGQILVEMGALSPYNLSRALVEQVEAKLFSIFAWSAGHYLFKADVPPPTEALRLDRAPAALILEGIRRHYDAERQQAVLKPHLGKYLKLSRDPMMRLQEVTSYPAEQEFIRGIDGRTRLETVLDSARIPADKARLLLVALTEAGVIEPSDAPAKRARVSTPTPASATPTLPDALGVPAGVPETSEPLTTSQLALVAQTVNARDHNWVLGVKPSDSIAAIDQAYESLARSFHPDRYRHRSEEARRLARDIFHRLTEAHGVLSDPGRRRDHGAKIERQRAMEPPSAPIPAGAERELFEAGMQHLRANRHRDAVEALRQAARMLPNQAEFRAALGWALFREAPADARAARAALAELRRAIQLDPKHRRARYYLGHLHAQTGQSELAIGEFEKLLELDPGAVDVADELRRLRESR
jgi:CheY-like chemotaxis protein/DnaJ-domain-containing protein 1